MEKISKITDFSKTFKKEDFLQSQQWKNFQESEGKNTFHFEEKNNSKNGETVFTFWANIIEQKLPVVGKYFYIPRGPIIGDQKNVNLLLIDDTKKSLDYLKWLAKENNAGWIRFDARSEKDLNLIKEASLKIAKEEYVAIKKSPHDMQPKNIFVVDVSKTEEDLLSEMKSKTRYNIRLAEKRGVIVNCAQSAIEREEYLEQFLKLNEITAERDKITTHPKEHYSEMIKNIPADILKVYIAKYNEKVIAANLVVFFEDTAIYLHGASSNDHRDVMAPYLLQWRQIKDAKKNNCLYYDFGGVTEDENSSWKGITRFKLGFSPKTKPTVFPGSYDIIVDPWKYALYRSLQLLKSFFNKIKKIVL